MSSRLLSSSSRISTSRRCDNCGITIDQVMWKQCKICHVFDLCDICGSDPEFDYANLLPEHRDRHERFHQKMSEHAPITGDCLQLVLIEEADRYGTEALKKMRQRQYDAIRKENKIQNDHELFVVMDKLKRFENASSTTTTTAEKTESDQLHSLIARYHLQASQGNIHVLSLDGGGVRGYMPIKILAELITQKYLSDIDHFNPKDSTHKELFQNAQLNFANQFDYFAGTSTGGLISFCLAMNYNILDLQEIYSKSSYYFKRNYLGPYIYSKYDPTRIHRKIDEIINGIPLKDGTTLSAENTTLLDIRNILNPDNIINDQESESAALYHGNFLEFVNEKTFLEDSENVDARYNLHLVKKEKVLLITAYNTTTNSITVFNTSDARYWGYRIADVLKATMAAPTYFPPYELSNGKKVNGSFVEIGEPELYIDGGVFANDPELATLWAIRMQWKKPVNYHLLSIGTGCYNTTLSSSTRGGYFAWILNKGFLINTMMDATRSFIETIGSNLAKFDNMKRMKLNYRMTKPMDLDDACFVNKFDEEWEMLKTEEDFRAFVYFYDKYIIEQN